MNKVQVIVNKITVTSTAGGQLPLRLMALLFMTIPLLSSYAFAQPVEQEAEPSSVSEAELEQGGMASNDESAEQSAAEEEQSERPDIDSQPIESDTSNRPGRFIPSEQISLDLGVSFPVDV